MDEFVVFLQPQQARECGMFVKQQIYARSRTFFRQLEVRYESQPEQLNKFLAAFEQGDFEGGKLEDFKRTMLQILKDDLFGKVCTF